jgi:hypothetical protein
MTAQRVMAELRERVQRRLVAKHVEVKQFANPLPRYDEVWLAGVRQLDQS